MDTVCITQPISCFESVLFVLVTRYCLSLSLYLFVPLIFFYVPPHLISRSISSYSRPPPFYNICYTDMYIFIPYIRLSQLFSSSNSNLSPYMIFRAGDFPNFRHPFSASSPPFFFVSARSPGSLPSPPVPTIILFLFIHILFFQYKCIDNGYVYRFYGLTCLILPSFLLYSMQYIVLGVGAFFFWLLVELSVRTYMVLLLRS